MEENVSEINISPQSPIVIKNDETKQIPTPVYDKDEEWVQKYIEQFGTEPSFF